MRYFFSPFMLTHGDVLFYDDHNDDDDDKDSNNGTQLAHQGS